MFGTNGDKVVGGGGGRSFGVTHLWSSTLNEYMISLPLSKKLSQEIFPIQYFKNFADGTRTTHKQG